MGNLTDGQAKILRGIDSGGVYMCWVGFWQYYGLPYDIAANDLAILNDESLVVIELVNPVDSDYCHCFLTEKGKQVLAEHENAKS